MGIKLIKNFTQALSASLAVVLVLVLVYLLIEPAVGRSASSSSGPFSIRQQIGDEIAFLVNAANVNMVGTLNGITGGNATGTTFAVVQSSSPSGYYMEIAFADTDGDGTIMRRDLGGTQINAIRNYSTSTYNRVVEPSFGFSFASSAAMFAYTVSASSSDLDDSFQNDGAACNTGSDTTEDLCWMAPTSTAFRIIDRATSATQGATTTIKFRVYIPNTPNPGVETGFYTATATLTAVNNP